MVSTTVLRRQVRALKRAGRRGRRRYPPELKARLVAAASELRRGGRSNDAIARELGVPVSTLGLWGVGGSQPAERTGGFREVRLRPEPAGRSAETVAVVTPLGYRVEGLSVAGAIELLVALS